MRTAAALIACLLGAGSLLAQDFGLAAKYEKMKAGAANAFVDPAGYKAYVSERNDAFRKEWARQQGPGGK